MFYRARGLCVWTVFDSTGESCTGSSQASRLSWWPPIALHPVTMPWAESVFACSMLLGDCVCRPCLTQRVHPAQVQVRPRAVVEAQLVATHRPSCSHYSLG